MYKFDCEKTTVARITVELSDDLQKYALDYLKIVNNVRDNSELHACGNYPGCNVVWVICDDDAAEAAAAWLGWFSKVREIEHLTGLKPFLLDHLMTNDEYDADSVVLPAESPFC